MIKPLDTHMCNRCVTTYSVIMRGRTADPLAIENCACKSEPKLQIYTKTLAALQEECC